MGGEELDYVLQAFNSNFIAPAGPQLELFERRFAERTGFRHCVALSSGTAAIHLALRVLGVGQGDTVLASTLTFIGSVAATEYVGAHAVFIDSESRSWNMDPQLLREEIQYQRAHGVQPSAILPTDLYGQSCDLDSILAIGREFGIPLVCDCAESLGATYQDRLAGNGASAAAFSFNGNKIITTSGGGMLASDNESVIQQARYLATQARQPVPHYEHVEVGYNYRMSNVVAAIGLGQLDVLSQRVQRKQEIFRRYQACLAGTPGISMMPQADFGQGNCWLTVIQVDPEQFGATPDMLRRKLEQENIESRPVWKPMHQQPAFRQNRVRGGRVAERLFERGLCLPSGTALADEQIEAICEIILATPNSNR